MLTVIVFLPLLGAALLAFSRTGPRPARGVWLAVTVADLALVVAMTMGYRPPAAGGLAYAEQVDWIPGAGVSYHVGVDGLSLPMLLVTDVLFAACAVWALRMDDRVRRLAALFLALQTTCLGLFAAQDLILFFLFFDLSIVAMYAVIAGWGHGEQAKRSALQFFLYTFLGSLALLVGFIGLYLGSTPHTFDIPTLVARAQGGTALAGGAVLGLILLGLAIKTPTVPFHTWLPPAHTDAPAVGSAILAGVLLKMGTYGFLRVGMPLLPDAWRSWAWAIVAVGLVSVLYGALVALAQNNVKRMIAYTSVNHMGYVVLAVGAAGLVAPDSATAREVAITGAVTQMVSHGLVTGALFLLAGVLESRAHSYEMDRFGGLAGVAPRYTALFAVGALASLGLPALSGFVAEFQIFTGSIAATWVAALALPGILLTAALFLRAFHRVFTGPEGPATRGFADLRGAELVGAGGLLALSLALGIVPGPVLDLIRPFAASVISAIGG
ncbi:NADH-quinone oxidoreductase subunit M [Isoptericola sp. b441]|uniref:NADH-quinone oxidoreductase subunit M n=1 Tax=Actinotalea lenta TaxID=3064654 RepID=A0ABT9DEN5_9CELL|nr:MULTISPECIES: NADH-quinone oxidoreductase subunit M [unclassified Isoptericola]MDO8107622.1 NADH-quinone oxidoreductase subunit M [Isoptericola sp. b441]MDO8120717.1 NADH-quinone oxidoreductase subunit M [Isoptericola sp. b490]